MFSVHLKRELQQETRFRLDWIQVSPPVFNLNGWRINEHVGSTIDVCLAAMTIGKSCIVRSSEEDLLAGAGLQQISSWWAYWTKFLLSLFFCEDTVRWRLRVFTQVRIFIRQMENLTLTGGTDKIRSSDVLCRLAHQMDKEWLKALLLASQTINSAAPHMRLIIQALSAGALVIIPLMGMTTGKIPARTNLRPSGKSHMKLMVMNFHKQTRSLSLCSCWVHWPAEMYKQ